MKKGMNKLKQIEITTRVENTLETTLKKLQKQGYDIIRKSRVEDEYLTQNLSQLNRNNITEILSTCVLLRYLNVNDDQEFKKITFKNKTYSDGIVMSEEKINVSCDSLSDAKKLFTALGFETIVRVCYDVIVVSNGKKELAFQNVENLGLLLEYESSKDFSDHTNEEIIQEKYQMLHEIKELGIDITDDYDIKKAYELIIKNLI